MLKFLLTPKWIALTLIAILLQPALYSLSQWQWRRLHERELYNSGIIKNEQHPPVSLVSVLENTSDASHLLVDTDRQWTTVALNGTWEANGQVLVRKQSYESNLGFWVVTPFQDLNGQTILINRGWTPAGSSALASPKLQPPPEGLVSVTGRLRLIAPRDNPKPVDLPAGQVDRIQPTEVTQATPIVSNGYLELISSTPESMTSELQPILPPEITEGPHRSYAWQWMIFAVMTLIGYGILVRKEIVTNRETKSAPDTASAASE